MVGLEELADSWSPGSLVHNGHAPILSPSTDNDEGLQTNVSLIPWDVRRVCGATTRTERLPAFPRARKVGPEVRRAGCAFVHSADGPSASAYCLPAELRPTRVPCSAQAAL